MTATHPSLHLLPHPTDAPLSIQLSPTPMARRHHANGNETHKLEKPRFRIIFASIQPRQTPICSHGSTPKVGSDHFPKRKSRASLQYRQTKQPSGPERPKPTHRGHALLPTERGTVRRCQSDRALGRRSLHAIPARSRTHTRPIPPSRSATLQQLHARGYAPGTLK